MALFVKARPLTVDEALQHLENVSEKKISEPPQRPKAAEVYLFSSEANPEKNSEF